MAITWGTLKAQVRRLLKDSDSARYKWTEPELNDYIGWSLNALCSHTALVTATSFVVDGTDYELPDNIYEPVSRAGAVYLSDGITKTYLAPVKFNRLDNAYSGYYLNPENTLHLVATTTRTELQVYYFAYYPHPVDDSDLILAPTWATAALTYRVAAYAFSPFAGRSANIRQWNRSPDTGRPTDNPMQEQSENYMYMYECELAKYPVQQRENYFHESLR